MIPNLELFLILSAKHADQPKSTHSPGTWIRNQTLGRGDRVVSKLSFLCEVSLFPLWTFLSHFVYPALFIYVLFLFQQVYFIGTCICWSYILRHMSICPFKYLFILVCLCMCRCTCMCRYTCITCMCRWLCMCVCMNMEVRGHTWVLSPSCHSLQFLRQSLHWPKACPLTSLAALEALAILLSHPPPTGLGLQAGTTMPSFLLGFWGLNSKLQQIIYQLSHPPSLSFIF